ncbi:MAG TPA: hypothetical protein PLC61_08505 [Chitinophagales bacterium]|nr:hypothetical protein [Chitinophagales bacterium]
MNLFYKNFYRYYWLISLFTLYLFFRSYQTFLDVSLLDESGYLLLSRFNPLIYPGGYGALYILCYKILHQLISNSMQLHFFAIIFLTWLPSIIVFYFLFFRKVPAFLCVFISWTLMLSPYIAAFDWWPRISHFAISFIFIFTIISFKYHFNKYKFLLFGILVCGILSYARPELMLSVYMLLGVLIAIFSYERIVQKKQSNVGFTKRNKILFSIMTFVFLAFLLVWKNPLKNTGRAYFALGQHYTFNVLRWENKDMTYFIRWPEVFEKKFGKSRTFKQMYKYNPSETKRHVVENIKHYFEQTYRFLPELWMPSILFKISATIKYIVFFLIYLVCLFYLGLNTYWQQLKQKVIDNFFYVLFFLIIATPSLFASFIIYPREHYFIMQLPLFLFLIYLLIEPFFSLKVKPSLSKVTLVITIFIILILTPNISAYPRFNKFDRYEQPNYVPYIKYLESLKIDKKVNFLTMEFLQIYLPNNYAYATEFFTKKPFYDSLIVAKDINLIYLSPYMENEPRHQSDSTFKYFMNNYSRLGWNKVQLKDKTGYLLIKQELLGLHSLIIE